MKKIKKLRVLALLTMVLVLCATMVATTLSRYIAKTEVLYKGETDLDYTVNSVFEVKSQEELFAAINQGYSYIQLSKDVENPLIITQQPTNLEADLILDLNGIEIQRNGPDPILNIGEGVKLTVTDTSSEQTGGLYNPVGSVFNIVGGTLSVVTGNFESGPRYSEYLSYNHDMLSAGLTTERTLVEEDPQLVNLTVNHKNSNGEITSQTQNGTYMPIIRSYPINTGEIIYTQGNLYCDKSVSLGVDRNIYFDRAERNNDIFFIPRDTYLYYSIDEDGSGSALLNNPLNAEWFYTYYATADTYAYVSADRPSDYDLNPDEYVEITIYAYYDTISEASDIDDPTQYYAAIQMQKGSLEVQSGGFYSYFGLSTTACVNASGGTIKVGSGNFSSRIPDAKGLVVSAIKVDDKNAFDQEYFPNFKWIDASFSTGSRAGQGGGYCILNHGSANVSVISGEFCSTNNNIIYMGDGNLTIGEGTFLKAQTIQATSFKDSDSAVKMDNGKLSISNASFMITGDFTAAICMDSGSIAVNKAEFEIEGSNTYAIYSTVDTTADGNDFNLTDADINMIGGNNQMGIYTMNGQVNLGTTNGNKATISLSGNDSKGIYADKGGSVVAQNYDVTLSGVRCTGIYSVGGAVDLSDGSVTLLSNNNCYGVYASSNSDIINVSLVNMSIDVGYEGYTESKNEDCAASIGVFMASGKDGSLITLDNATVKCYELGLVLRGGSLTLKNGGTVKTRKASAIYVDGGTLTFEDNSNGNAVYTVESSNTTNTTYINTYDITVPLGNGSVAYDNLHGIYVNGGSFLCYGMLDFVHTGLQNSPYAGGSLTNNGVKYYYNGLKVRSHAVCVEGGNVVIEKCDIEAKSGGGVYCSGGNITLGNKDKTGSITTLNQLVQVNTTGTYAKDYNDVATESESANTWKNRRSLTGGHAIELNGGNINVYYGHFEAQFGNGLQVTGNSTGSGVINVHNGKFVGNMKCSSTLGGIVETLTGKSGPAAYYGLKVVGAATVNIYNGVFDGGNGGALVTGIDAYAGTYNYSSAASNNNDAVVKRALVYVYAGEFGNSSSVDAFNIFDNATVIFGAYSESEATTRFDTNATEHNNAIKLNASNAPIAFNNLGDDGKYKEYVYLYYGTYNSGNGKLFGYNDDNLKVYNSDSGSGYYTLVKATESPACSAPNQTVYFDKNTFRP